MRGTICAPHLFIEKMYLCRTNTFSQWRRGWSRLAASLIFFREEKQRNQVLEMWVLTNNLHYCNKSNHCRNSLPERIFCTPYLGNKSTFRSHIPSHVGNFNHSFYQIYNTSYSDLHTVRKLFSSAFYVYQKIGIFILVNLLNLKWSSTHMDQLGWWIANFFIE